MANYRYLVTDLLTDLPIDVIPLTGVSFERKISRVGAFRGAWAIPDREAGMKAIALSQRTGRSAIYAYRDNTCMWGGILWTMTPSMDERNTNVLNLQAATFDSYAHHRKIRKDFSFTQVEQAEILRAFWDEMQATSAGNIGMQFDNPATGILRDRTYIKEDAGWYGSRIEELGDVIDGPEHTIDVFDINGVRRKVFRTGNLFLGGSEAEPITITGQRMPDWSSTIDATASGTHYQARGDSIQDNVGEESYPLMSSEWVAQDLIDQGWPQLDITNDYSGVVEVATLDEKAQGDLARTAGSIKSPDYSVYLDNTSWTPNDIGKSIRILRSANDWWAPGTEDIVRPVAVTVTPADRTHPELVKLTVEESTI